jgi:DNA helicase MCM8
VANFCDVQELKIQEVREEFCEDLESEMANGGDGGGGGGNQDEGRDAGRAPRHMEVEVVNDLVDQCHAGDSIVVVGIVRAVNSALASGRVGKRAVETSTYKLYVQGHSILNLTSEDGGARGGRSNKRNGNEFDDGDGGHDSNKRQKSSSNMQYTDQQLQNIANLAHADHRMYSMPTRMAFPFDLLVRSLCPNIIGNDLVKAGIILCLLGGTPPDVSGLEARSGMTIRSNSHLLCVGDPGMGKSQLLLSANQVAARSVYVGGNTASSRGLTVSLTKEAGGDMGIEAGALVLADRGVCCLDELDKMPKTHQDGLLEAMEQQQVSIAKAGVVASLPSRCSVIAAANPKSGHYNLSKSVAENLSMNGPLLSRFDLVFILRDEADSDRDRMISGSIMGRVRNDSSQRDNHQTKQVDARMASANLVPMKHRLPWVTNFQKQPLPQQQLKDYIAYAKEYCRPKMTDAAAEVLSDYFMKLRHPGLNESKKDNVPITTRQLEALIRLSQARAKACLRPYVLKEDAEDVVELMIESVKQVHMDESGQVDKARGGVGGKSKQRRSFLQAMRDSGQHEFLYSDLQRIADRLNLPVGGFKDFVEDVRESGEIQRTYNGSTTIYKLYS